MTLPIPMVRSAAEPPVARQGNEPIASTGDDGAFGKALANAVHDASNAPGDGARTRRARGGRSSANASNSSTETHTARSAGQSTASSETNTSQQDEITIGATDVALQTTAHELTADAGMAFIDALATWQGATADATASVAGDAEFDDASTTTDGSEGDATSSLSERFVASSLEAAIAPLAPLALVVSPAVAGATSGTSPLPSEKATTASPAALVLAERAARPDDDARLAGIAAAMARNPRAVRREVEALVPELRQRLDRVIDRMEQEYGYTVEVVETVRTQERQDALYAQGRTQPGPVVTWTRNSKHLDGAAADVVIDGGYDNAAGFERLARVAREEGLRTLWPRDPGHIELVPNAAAANPARIARTVEGDAVILPAPTAEAPAPAIPRTARAGLDPAALRREATAALLTGDGAALPSPVGESHVLPFPSAVIPRLGEEGEGRALPLRGKGPLGAMPSGALPATAMGAAAQKGAAPLPSFTPAAAQASQGVAHVAAVAQVAQVAPVAQVARVAEVATVGDVRTQGGPAAVPATVLTGATMARESQTRGSGRGDRQSAGERGAGSEGARGDAVASAVLSSEGKESSRVPFVREIVAQEGSPASSSAPVAGLSRSDATERIARVLRIQESGGDRPLSSVLLRLESPDGGEDRIRIDLRGRSVGATLDVADPRAAEQLRLHVTELQDALQRQGLEGEAMVVRTTQRSMDASTLTATAVAAERDVLRTASASASDGGGSTAKDSRNQSRAPFEREFEREGTDQQRSRQRRDGKGESR